VALETSRTNRPSFMRQKVIRSLAMAFGKEQGAVKAGAGSTSDKCDGAQNRASSFVL